MGITYNKVREGEYVVTNDSGCRSAAAHHFGRDLKPGEGPWGSGSMPRHYPATIYFSNPSNQHPSVRWEPLSNPDKNTTA
ncbi:hypothetical protein D3C81_193200 [compost metagenome]